MPRVTKRMMAIRANDSLIQFAMFYEGVVGSGFLNAPILNIGGAEVSLGVFLLIYLSFQRGLTSRLRYLPGVPSFKVPNSTSWTRAVLPLYDAARRAPFILVNDEVFNYIISFFSRHCKRIFKPRRGPEKHSLRLQAAIGLTRIGSYGNDASVGRIAALFGASEGFVSNATSRTNLALNCISSKFIKWPNRSTRHLLYTHAAQHYGFPGAIGSADGTTIPLFMAPAVVPWSVFDRKSRHSLHALVTVNHHYEVLGVVVNYLGPASDSVVQRDAVWQQFPEDFFTHTEYLLGDKGMLHTLQVIIPYKGKHACLSDNANFQYPACSFGATVA